MKFIVSEKNTENGTILVVTDAEILGKVHLEGKKQLDLSKRFYQGEEKSPVEVEEMVERAYILHLTGKNAVELGIQLGIVDKNKILVIKGIPHAEAVVVRE